MRGVHCLYAYAEILGVHFVPDDPDVIVASAFKAGHSERKLWTLMPYGATL